MKIAIIPQTAWKYTFLCLHFILAEIKKLIVRNK